jgi:hypothetical protein
MIRKSYIAITFEEYNSGREVKKSINQCSRMFRNSCALVDYLFQIIQFSCIQETTGLCIH